MSFDIKKAITHSRAVIETNLNGIDEKIPFSKNSYVKLNKFTFFWIYGDDDFVKRFVPLIRLEINRIVSENQAMQIFTYWMAKQSDEIVRIILSGIKEAGMLFLDVDTNTINLCPIIQSKFLIESAENGMLLSDICSDIDKAIIEHRRQVEWHPFYLYDDEDISICEKGIDEIRSILRQLVENGRKFHVQNCYPCCLQSDTNEKGQSVSDEQISRNIVMTIVCQNTDFKDSHKVGRAVAPLLSKEQGDCLQDECFFTTSSVSITEPVKSLALCRMRALHRSFLKGYHDDVFYNMKYRFFKEAEWRERIAQIPHDKENCIRIDPLVSIMGYKEKEEYEKAVIEFGKTIYTDPLYKDGRKLFSTWWKSFWNEYFSLGGSLNKIKELNECKSEIIEKVDLLPVGRIDKSFLNSISSNIAFALAEQIEKVQRNFLDEAIKYSTKTGGWYGRFINIIDAVLESLDNAITFELNKVQQVELLLTTGGAHVATAEEEADSWVEEYVASDRDRYVYAYNKYAITCNEIANHVSDDSDTSEAENIIYNALDKLLMLYTDFVSNSFDSREMYMEKQLETMNDHRLEGMTSSISTSRVFPIRRIGAKDADRGMYMLANDSSMLSKRINNMDRYDIAFKGSMQKDRIELLRVSNLMSTFNILGR